jgi:hypothetical protein
MRVFVGPRAEQARDAVAAAVALALAGPDDAVVHLRQIGVSNLARPLTAAEVALLRAALLGRALSRGHDEAERRAAADGGGPGRGAAVVGYVCRGVGATGPPARLVAVTDHVNLTWRSPLTGPNDDEVGPRFPSMTGIYAPEYVLDPLGAAEGMIVAPGIVAGVRDDARLTASEAETVAAQGYFAVSSELVPVIIVAAHLGLRVAAVVIAEGTVVEAGTEQKETGSGRP